MKTSTHPQTVSSVSAHATGARDTLRLLTLLAMVLVIVFKSPVSESDDLATVVASHTPVTTTTSTSTQ